MTRPLRKTAIAFLCLAGIAALASCRGKISTSPPMHLVLDMDFQAKLKAQSKSDFEGWSDHRGMRLPVPGTVARGSLTNHNPDPAVARLHVYKDEAGKYVANPIPKSREVVDQGRRQYDINCAICHGRTGRGNGPVGLKWPVQAPPSYHTKPGKNSGLLSEDRIDERVASLSDGELFEVITNGKNTMMSYRHQVPVANRWAIIHYIRVLQLRAKD